MAITNLNSKYQKSFPEAFDSKTFKKIKEVGPENLVGVQVHGILGHKSTKGMSYSLACTSKSEVFWLNIPQWLGKSILDDFNNEGQKCEEYWAGVTIKEVSPVTTPNGDTYNITFAKN